MVDADAAARPLGDPEGRSPPVPPVSPAQPAPSVDRIAHSLSALSEDGSVPRNVRRGAQAAREALLKGGVALDLRVASAVYVLDDLANDSNLPTHGRTAIWSIISHLESLQ